MKSIARHLFGLTLLAAALGSPGLAFAAESGPDPAVKASFKRLISERTRLIRELDRLDERAADAVARGSDPIELHAAQSARQDELDLLQLRLESMAIRHTLVLPEAPRPDEVQAVSEGTESRARARFRIGQERTSRVVARRTRDLLARLDFQHLIER